MSPIAPITLTVLPFRVRSMSVMFIGTVPTLVKRYVYVRLAIQLVDPGGREGSSLQSILFSLKQVMFTVTSHVGKRTGAIEEGTADGAGVGSSCVEIEGAKEDGTGVVGAAVRAEGGGVGARDPGGMMVNT